MNEIHNRYREYLEKLSMETLPSLASYVHSDVQFKDPFNDVRGVSAMYRIFEEMFEKIGSVEFRVEHLASDENICLMAWRFEAMLRGEPWKFLGTSIITFSPDGLVEKHEDYWDSANDFYKYFPIIGWVLEKLRCMVSVH